MTTTTLDRSRSLQRPGWPEIVAAIIGFAVAILVGAQTIASVIDPTTILYGLSLSALSAFIGLVAFLAAYLIRFRSKISFGLSRPSGRWLGQAVLFGIGVFLASRGLTLLYVSLGGPISNVQAPYYEAATGGVLSFLAQLLLIAIVTPIGEELAFRSVLANALLRYGPWVSILVSSTIFALAHGWNEVFITAFVTGLAASYLFYRKGSVWPAVVVHVMNNALATLLSLVISFML